MPLMRQAVGALLTTAAVLAVTVMPAASQTPGLTPAERRASFLKLIDRPRVPAAPSAAVVTVENGHRQERLSFASERDERVPLLFIGKADPARPQAVVIVLHGTGGSKEGMRDRLEALAARGFLAVAMDAPHHGERATPIPGLEDPYQSAMLRAFRTGEGHPYMYDTVWDVMRLIDYLVTRPDVDPSRIGVVGLSKGGTESYLAAAVDERIAAVAPQIGVQSYGWSLRRPFGWEARIWTLRRAVEAAAADSGTAVNAAFVRRFYNRITPGIVDEFDGPAMLPLIAPRPLLVVNSDSDPRSPLGGVREATAAAERAYASAGAPEKFVFMMQVDAAHEVTREANAATVEWFVRWLSPSGQ